MKSINWEQKGNFKTKTKSTIIQWALFQPSNYSNNTKTYCWKTFIFWIPGVNLY